VQFAQVRRYMPPRSSDWRSPNFHGGTDRSDQSGIGLAWCPLLMLKLFPFDHPVMMPP
jgi:hypothetical protein